MPKQVALPDGSVGEFPDDMEDAAIEQVLQRQFGGQQAPSTREALAADADAEAEAAPEPVDAPGALRSAVGGYARTAFPSWESVKTLGKVAAQPATRLLPFLGDVASGIAAGAKGQFEKSRQAFGERRPEAAVGHMLAAAIPGVGPIAAEAVEKSRTPGTRAEGVGEMLGLIPQFSPLSALSRINALRYVGPLRQKGYSAIARGLAPDAAGPEAAYIAEHAAPVLFEEGTTRGMPGAKTLAGRIQGQVEERSKQIRERLAGPEGELADIPIEGVRASTRAVEEGAKIKDTAAQVSISPRQFHRITDEQKAVVLKDQDEMTATYLVTGKRDPDASFTPDDAVDLDVAAWDPVNTRMKVEAHKEMQRDVDMSQAASAVARGQFGDTEFLTRRQAVQLRRQLDEASSKYRKGIVPTDPGPATKAAAFGEGGSQLRRAINTVDPELGAFNRSEHANLVARDAIEKTIDDMAAGASRGEKYAQTRGLASGLRVIAGAISGGAVTGGTATGAIVGAAALPLAYEALNSTPLRILGGNTRLKIAAMIARGDVEAAARIAAAALQTARTHSLIRGLESPEAALDPETRRKMSAIE